MGVCIPVMVVQDEDRRYNRGRHHEHDAIEVGSWKDEDTVNKLTLILSSLGTLT